MSPIVGRVVVIGAVTVRRTRDPRVLNFRTPAPGPAHVSALSPWLAALLLGLCMAGVGAAASPWRFWSSAEGLTESYSTVLARDREGRILVRHGNVATMTELDG